MEPGGLSKGFRQAGYGIVAGSDLDPNACATFMLNFPEARTVFVLVTNEFDAARLLAACERRRQSAALFTSVVHVNPEGVLAAYGQDLSRSAKRLISHVESDRLQSLSAWLTSLLS